MERYTVEGPCLVDNDTGEVKLEAVDTPRNMRKLCRLRDRLNRQERDRASIDRFMRTNRASWA